KIELALRDLHFSGRVILLDKDPRATAALLRFLPLIAPPFRAEAINADLFSATPAATAELVLANHALDDLLFDRWAGAPLPIDDEGELRAAWARLLHSQSLILAEHPPPIARALHAHVKPGGALVLVEYEGHVEQLLGTSARPLFAALFSAVRR